jgi:hypothetical protein
MGLAGLYHAPACAQRADDLVRALVYNWWSLFTRLSTPNTRGEAITSRPLLPQAIGRRTTHSNQSSLTLTSLHAEAGRIQVAMKAVAGFLG